MRVPHHFHTFCRSTTFGGGEHSTTWREGNADNSQQDERRGGTQREGVLRRQPASPLVAPLLELLAVLEPACDSRAWVSLLAAANGEYFIVFQVKGLHSSLRTTAECRLYSMHLLMVDICP